MNDDEADRLFAAHRDIAAAYPKLSIDEASAVIGASMDAEIEYVRRARGAHPFGWGWEWPTTVEELRAQIERVSRSGGLRRFVARVRARVAPGSRAD